MARTDDHSCGITESVGATALGNAAARASESESACALFTDPYAQMFIDAATARGWSAPLNEATVYAACRTRFFDDFFIAAGAAGIEQAVILAAGLDVRAWRLPSVSGSTVYEIDQHKVLEFKAETLRTCDAKPATKCVAVPVDLPQHSPKELRDAGFQPTEPTAWSAEGQLLNLPDDAQDLMFERIQELTATDSRIAVEAFLEERADVALWLGEHGWDVTATEAGELMARYHRDAPGDIEDVTPPSIFVDGHYTC